MPGQPNPSNYTARAAQYGRCAPLAPWPPPPCPTAPTPPRARPQVVHTCVELRDALNDTSVGHVVMAASGSFNCSVEEFPPGAVTVQHREVLLGGESPYTYIDVGAGGWVLLGGP